VSNPSGTFRGLFSLAPANAFYSGCQWLSIVLVARKLSIEDVGALGLGMAVASPIVLFLEMEQRSLLASDNTTGIHPVTYLAFRIMALFSVAVIAAVSMFLYNHITPGILIFAAILGLKLVESLSDITYGLFLQLGHNYLIVRSLYARGISLLFGFLIGIYFFESILVSLIAVIFFSFLIAVTHDVLAYTRRTHICSITKSDLLVELRELARLGLPLALTNVLASVNSSMPKYLLVLYSTLPAVGIFTLLYHFVTAANTFLGSLNQLFLPQLGSAARSCNITHFRNSCFQLLAANILVGLLAIAGVLLAGEQLLGIVYSESVSQHNLSLLVVVTGGLLAFLATATAAIAVALRIVNFQPIVVFFALLVTFISGYFLIHWLDDPVLAAALSMLAGRAIQFIGNAWFVRTLAPKSFTTPEVLLG